MKISDWNKEGEENQRFAIPGLTSDPNARVGGYDTFMRLYGQPKQQAAAPSSVGGVFGQRSPAAGAQAESGIGQPSPAQREFLARMNARGLGTVEQRNIRESQYRGGLEKQAALERLPKEMEAARAHELDVVKAQGLADVQKAVAPVELQGRYSALIQSGKDKIEQDRIKADVDIALNNAKSALDQLKAQGLIPNTDEFNARADRIAWDEANKMANQYGAEKGLRVLDLMRDVAKAQGMDASMPTGINEQLRSVGAGVQTPEKTGSVDFEKSLDANNDGTVTSDEINVGAARYDRYKQLVSNPNIVPSKKVIMEKYIKDWESRVAQEVKNEINNSLMRG